MQCVKSFLKIFSLISKFFAHYKKNVFRTKVCSTVHVACFHSIFQRPFERPEKNLLSKFVLSNSRKTWLTLGKQGFSTQCLKITEKVSFNIESEASNVYILTVQKLTKNAKNVPFWRVFDYLKACGQTVLPDR